MREPPRAIFAHHSLFGSEREGDEYLREQVIVMRLRMSLLGVAQHLLHLMRVLLA
jgi:hypothetical protein